MAWRGDSLSNSTWSDFTITMSTAIIIAYSPEGFVIAADGLQKHTEDPAKSIWSAQKIMNLSRGENYIACALTGWTQFISDETGDMIFDFNREVADAVADLGDPKPRCKDLQSYSARIAKSVYERLRACHSRGLIPDLLGKQSESDPDQKTIVSAFLLGYYNGRHAIVDVEFNHRNQKLVKPALSARSCKYMEGVGSRSILNSLFNTLDPRLAKYRTFDPLSSTMAEQIKKCGSYVRACSDPEAVNIDPACANIGGRLHVATIRPGVGFSWVVPPNGTTA